VDLTGLLEEARDSIGVGPDEVKLSLDAELPALVADAVQVERAFANLFDQRGPPQRGTAGAGPLPADRGDGWWSGWSTRGPGSRRPERERIFEPFYRRGPGGSQGSGLGLAIARGFVEAQRPARSRSSRCPARAAPSSSHSPSRREPVE